MHVEGMNLQEAESWVPYFVNKISDIKSTALDTQAAFADLEDVVGHIENLGGTVDPEAKQLLGLWS